MDVEDGSGADDISASLAEVDLTDFSEELVCHHGQINPNEKCWALVGEDAWRLITRFFPATRKVEPFTTTDDSFCAVPLKRCLLCQMEASETVAMTQVARSQIKPYEAGQVNPKIPKKL